MLLLKYTSPPKSEDSLVEVNHNGPLQLRSTQALEIL